MNLIEQYQTLLKRGMPECRATWWSDGWYVCGCDRNGNDDAARDLITMHALRWWLGLKCIEPTTVAFGANDEMGVPIKDKCRDDGLNRELSITSFAREDSGWRADGPVNVATDVFESDHYDPCTRYRSHDMNDDESDHGVNDTASAILSTILAATAHLEP